MRLQSLAHRLDSVREIGAKFIHFVNEGQERNTEQPRLTPDCFGLRFHARRPVENNNPTIQNPQAALHLGGKIDVTGGIHDIDLIPAPIRRDGG